MQQKEWQESYNEFSKCLSFQKRGCLKLSTLWMISGNRPRKTDSFQIFFCAQNVFEVYAHIWHKFMVGFSALDQSFQNQAWV